MSRFEGISLDNQSEKGPLSPSDDDVNQITRETGKVLTWEQQTMEIGISQDEDTEALRSIVVQGLTEYGTGMLRSVWKSEREAADYASLVVDEYPHIDWKFEQTIMNMAIREVKVAKERIQLSNMIERMKMFQRQNQQEMMDAAKTGGVDMFRKHLGTLAHLERNAEQSSSRLESFSVGQEKSSFRYGGDFDKISEVERPSSIVTEGSLIKDVKTNQTSEEEVLGQVGQKSLSNRINNCLAENSMAAIKYDIEKSFIENMQKLSSTLQIISITPSRARSPDFWSRYLGSYLNNVLGRAIRDVYLPKQLYLEAGIDGDTFGNTIRGLAGIYWSKERRNDYIRALKRQVLDFDAGQYKTLQDALTKLLSIQCKAEVVNQDVAEGEKYIFDVGEVFIDTLRRSKNKEIIVLYTRLKQELPNNPSIYELQQTIDCVGNIEINTKADQEIKVKDDNPKKTNVRQVNFKTRWREWKVEANEKLCNEIFKQSRKMRLDKDTELDNQKLGILTIKKNIIEKDEKEEAAKREDVIKETEFERIDSKIAKVDKPKISSFKTSAVKMIRSVNCTMSGDLRVWDGSIYADHVGISRMVGKKQSIAVVMVGSLSPTEASGSLLWQILEDYLSSQAEGKAALIVYNVNEDRDKSAYKIFLEQIQECDQVIFAGTKCDIDKVKDTKRNGKENVFVHYSAGTAASQIFGSIKRSMKDEVDDCGDDILVSMGDMRENEVLVDTGSQFTVLRQGKDGEAVVIKIHESSIESESWGSETTQSHVSCDALTAVKDENGRTIVLELKEIALLNSECRNPSLISIDHLTGLKNAEASLHLSRRNPEAKSSIRLFGKDNEEYTIPIKISDGQEEKLEPFMLLFKPTEEEIKQCTRIVIAAPIDDKTKRVPYVTAQVKARRSDDTGKGQKMLKEYPPGVKKVAGKRPRRGMSKVIRQVIPGGEERILEIKSELRQIKDEVSRYRGSIIEELRLQKPKKDDVEKMVSWIKSNVEVCREKSTKLVDFEKTRRDRETELSGYYNGRVHMRMIRRKTQDLSTVAGAIIMPDGAPAYLFPAENGKGRSIQRIEKALSSAIEKGTRESKKARVNMVKEAATTVRGRPQQATREEAKKEADVELQACLGYVSEERLRRTLMSTTWYLKTAYGRRIPLKSFKRRYDPTIRRIQDSCAMDTLFATAPGANIACMQVFKLNRSKFIYTTRMGKKADVHRAVKRFVREVGAPIYILSDQAKEVHNKAMADYLNDMNIGQRSSAPYNQHQNRAENAINYLKSHARLVMDKACATPKGSKPSKGLIRRYWDYAVEFVASVHNKLANKALDDGSGTWKTPEEQVFGETVDISSYAAFKFGQRVGYLDVTNPMFPESKTKYGIWLGPNQYVGGQLCSNILTKSAGGSYHVIHRENVFHDESNELERFKDLREKEREESRAIHQQRKKQRSQLEEVEGRKGTIYSIRKGSDQGEKYKVKPSNVRGEKDEVILKVRSTNVTGKLELEGFNTDESTIDVDEEDELWRDGRIPEDDEINESSTVEKEIEEESSDEEDRPDNNKIHEEEAEDKEERPKSGKGKVWRMSEEKSMSLVEKEAAEAEARFMEEKFIEEGQRDIIELSECKIREMGIEMKVSWKLPPGYLEGGDHEDVEILTYDMMKEEYPDQTARFMSKITDQQIEEITKEVLEWSESRLEGSELKDKMPTARRRTLMKRLARTATATVKDARRWAQAYITSPSINALKTCKVTSGPRIPYEKYGILVPNCVKKALQEDQTNRADQRIKTLIGSQTWYKSMKKEMDKFYDYEAIEWMPSSKLEKLRKEGFTKVRTSWVFDVKAQSETMEGLINELKSRFVIDGSRVDNGGETYMSMVGFQNSRILFALADHFKFDIAQGDISNAYLSSHIAEEEKCYFIAGEEWGDKAGMVGVFKKAVYGLKTSGHMFRNLVDETMRRQGFNVSEADENIYYRLDADKEHYTWVAFHSDDFICVSRDTNAILEEIQRTFKIKAFERPKRFLGCDITEDGGKFRFNPKSYIEEILNHVTPQNGNEFAKKKTPLPVECDPYDDESELLDEAGKRLFQRYIGIWVWLAQIGRPDIRYATMLLSRHVAAPRRGHLKLCDHVWGYLRANRSLSLPVDAKPFPGVAEFDEKLAEDMKKRYPDTAEEVSPNDPESRGEEIITTVFADASWAGDKHGARSVTGLITFIGSTLIGSKASRGTAVETSSFSAEYACCRVAVEQAYALRMLLRSIGVKVASRTRVCIDNLGVVQSGSVYASPLKKKHTMISYHKTREAIACGAVALVHVRSEDNLADMCTKLLGRNTLKTLLRKFAVGVDEDDSPQEQILEVGH